MIFNIEVVLKKYCINEIQRRYKNKYLQNTQEY